MQMDGICEFLSNFSSDPCKDMNHLVINKVVLELS